MGAWRLQGWQGARGCASCDAAVLQLKHVPQTKQAPTSHLTNLPLEDLVLQPNLLVRTRIDSLTAARLLP